MKWAEFSSLPVNPGGAFGGRKESGAVGLLLHPSASKAPRCPLGVGEGRKEGRKRKEGRREKEGRDGKKGREKEGRKKRKGRKGKKREEGKKEKEGREKEGRKRKEGKKRKEGMERKGEKEGWKERKGKKRKGWKGKEGRKERKARKEKKGREKEGRKRKFSTLPVNPGSAEASPQDLEAEKGLKAAEKSTGRRAHARAQCRHKRFSMPPVHHPGPRARFSDLPLNWGLLEGEAGPHPAEG
ncbi:Nucleolar protein 58, partial [Ophiophagus hannah]